MRRRIMLVSVWAGGTLVAVLLATFAVSLAGAKVTEHSLRPISHEHVDDEATESVADRERRDIITLPTTTAPEGSGEPEASTETGSGEPHDPSAARSPGNGSPSGGGTGTPGASPATSAGGGGPNGGGSSGGGSSHGGPSTSSGPSSGGGGSPGGPGPSNSSGGGPGPSGGGGGGQGPSSGAPTTTAATAVRAAYSLTGGSVIVTCTGSSISASASPSSGFATDPSSHLGGGGATQIEVKFRQVAGEHESELKAVCVGGRPQPEVNEG